MSTTPEDNLNLRSIPLRKLWKLMDGSTLRKLSIWTIVSLLTTGLPATAQAAVQNFATNAVSLGFDDLFLQTAPLIWAVAFVAFAWHQQWLEAAGIIPAAGLILAGSWLGHFFVHGSAVEPIPLLPTDRYALLGAVVFRAVNQLAAYFISYGPVAFLSAIIVGSTLGTIWSSTLIELRVKLSSLVERSPAAPGIPPVNQRKAA